jgi:hypothetical protein
MFAEGNISPRDMCDQVRLQLRFQKQLLLGQPISEVRIGIWDPQFINGQR